MKKSAISSLIYLMFLVGIDQLVNFVLTSLYPSLVTLNQGILFGFVTNIYIVGILLVIGSIILGYLIFRTHEIDISLLLVLAGAVSNVIDRFIYGGVVDYIHFFSISQFNLADTYIVLGLVIYVYKVLYIARFKH